MRSRDKARRDQRYRRSAHRRKFNLSEALPKIAVAGANPAPDIIKDMKANYYTSSESRLSNSTKAKKPAGGTYPIKRRTKSHIPWTNENTRRYLDDKSG